MLLLNHELKTFIRFLNMRIIVQFSIELSVDLTADRFVVSASDLHKVVDIS